MDKKLCYGCMKYLEENVPKCDCGFDPDTYEPAPHQLIPGTLLHERYLVGKVIGEGGFGITYVGQDTVLEIKVAIKEFYMSGYVNRNNTVSTIVRASVGNNAELFERNKEKFLTEARVLAKFADEEGIVGIRDYFQENNTAYIVMDFLTGETLRDCLAHKAKLSWQETLDIMRPVLNSLANIHEHQIIHRDISPDNIMLTTDGKVKLLDFGAAREVSQNDIKSLSVILKPGYAPEEQYRSKGQQGPWTDIYALCATIYCCVTGVVPDDAMERMFDDKLRTPHEIEPSCKLAVSEVIMKGMAVRQKDRYQSILELQADLIRAQEAPEGVSLGINNGQNQDSPRLAADINATIYAEEMRHDAVDKNVLGSAEANRVPRSDDLGGTTVEVPRDPIAQEQAAKVVDSEEKTSQEKASPGKASQEKASPEKKPQQKEESQKESRQKETHQEKTRQKDNQQIKQKAPRKPGKILVVVAIIVVLSIGGIILASLNGSTRSGYSRIEAENMNDKLSSLQNSVIVINSKEIELPIAYSDFVRCGWDAKDPATMEQVLAPKHTSYEVSFLNVKKGFGTMDVRFYNPSDSEKSYKDCYIYYVSCYMSSFNSGNYAQKENNTFVLKNSVLDLVVGETTADEFRNAFSQKKKDSSCSLEFSDTQMMSLFFSNDVLYAITVKNTNMPVDYVDYYQTTPPAYDKEQFAQAADLGYSVELIRQDGTTYVFQTSVLLQDYVGRGWTIEDGPEYLPARGEVRLHIRKDARTIQEVYVMNPTGEARSIKNCFVTKISLAGSSLLTGDCVKLCISETGEKIICNGTYNEAYQALSSAVPTECISVPEDYKIQLSSDEGKDCVKITYSANGKDNAFTLISLDSENAVKEFFQNN